ncbi:unnamed protein product [Lampetra fluviatilis]
MQSTAPPTHFEAKHVAVLEPASRGCRERDTPTLLPLPPRLLAQKRGGEREREELSSAYTIDCNRSLAEREQTQRREKEREEEEETQAKSSSSSVPFRSLLLQQHKRIPPETDKQQQQQLGREQPCGES